MRKGLSFAAVLCLLLPWAGLVGPEPAVPVAALSASPPGEGQAKIAPELQAQMAALPPDGMVTAIVSLQTQPDLAHVAGSSRAARLKGVITALQATADASQKPIRALLAARRAQGLAGQVIPFWVFNGLAVTATQDVIQELAARSDVRWITPDAISIIPAASLAAAPEPNLTVVNAPALWDLGVAGQGIVVANMDSGVDASHPDLASRWRGGTNSWYDPYGQHPLTPTDLTGHGTWTMGVMVGGDEGGTAIGVAPGAQWIAVKIWSDAGGATTTAIHLGFQWLLDPDGDPETGDAPHVVNNSWTFAYPGCNLEFEPDLEALQAAGILPVFAAGNGGPSPGTSYSPANNPSAFAVGGTDDNDLIYVYSSRGPSSCGEPTTIYPELVAPGVEIHTTDLYGLYYDVTGTSLAAPHVSGGVALLLSAYPNLSAVAQAQALMAGAVDLGLQGPDNDFGYGRLDLLAAYEIAGQAAGESANLAIEKSDVLDPVEPGGVVTYTLSVINGGPLAATAVTVTDELPPEATYGGASGEDWTCIHAGGVVTCTRPALAPGAAPSIIITVTAPAEDMTITNTATVTSATSDPWLFDNVAGEQTGVETPQADLSVAKSDAPDPVQSGGTVTYSLSITNRGPLAATAITVTDQLPPEVTFGSASGEGWDCAYMAGTVICSRPSLGLEVAPPILLSVTAPQDPGSIVNRAEVRAVEADPKPEDNAATATTQIVPMAPDYRIYLPLVVK